MTLVDETNEEDESDAIESSKPEDAVADDAGLEVDEESEIEQEEESDADDKSA